MIFFFNSSSKWVVKQQRQLATSTTHLAQELLMNVHCSGGSRSFAKKMRALRWGVQWPAMGSWQWLIERIIAANPLTTTREAAEELSVDRSSVVRHLKQIGKVKNLNKWVPHELPEKKKIFEVLSSLILCKNNEPFLDRIVTYEEKWILQDNLRWSAQLLDQEEAERHVPKPKCTKKRPWSLLGGLLPAWSTIAFWSRQNHYIWEVCSANVEMHQKQQRL